MSYKTLNELTQGIISKIGLVTGTGVQTYTEPQIKSGLQDGFAFLFRKRFWDHLSDWHTFTLDGTTGHFVEDIDTKVKSFEDIREVYFGTDMRNRVVKPVGHEHLALTNHSHLRYYTPEKYGSEYFETKVLKFWPITATGTVTLYARTHPGTFKDSDKIPLPYDLLEWAGTWLTLETDGMNPTNSNKAQQLFQIAYNDYVAATNDDVIGHGGGNYGNTVWPSGI